MELLDHREATPCVEITVVDVKGSAPRAAGARMFWRPGGQASGTIGGGNLEQRAMQEAELLWNDAERETAFLEYPLSAKLGQCCGGHVRIFLAKRMPPREALICGAGHVATALAKVLSDSPFRVTVVDPRIEWAARDRFPAKVAVNTDDPEIVVRDWGSGREGVERASRTYLLIMTHQHPVDEALCRAALRHPFRWIGLIGSRTKWLRFRQRLAARGFTSEELARIICPIGNPGLGKSPLEIAVGTAAQMLAHYHGTGLSEVDVPPERAPGKRAALVLGGGASRRMGRWKGGLDWRGGPILAAHGRICVEAGAEIWKAVYPAVYRAEAEKIIGPAHRILNNTPDAPMFASLQLGLRELIRERPDLDSVLITPVDAPPLDEDWIAALWDRHEAAGAWVTQPRSMSLASDRRDEARHGHPIILDQRLFGPILAADAETARLDFLIRDLPDALKAEFEFPGMAPQANLNTPEDYEKAIAGEPA